MIRLDFSHLQKQAPTEWVGTRITKEKKAELVAYASFHGVSVSVVIATLIDKLIEEVKI